MRSTFARVCGLLCEDIGGECASIVERLLGGGMRIVPFIALPAACCSLLKGQFHFNGFAMLQTSFGPSSEG